MGVTVIINLANIHGKKVAAIYVIALLTIYYGVTAYIGLFDYDFDTPSPISLKSPYWDFANLWLAGDLVNSDRVNTLFDVEEYRETLRMMFGPNIEDSEWSYPPTIL